MASNCASDAQVGKRVKCPSCGETQLVKRPPVNGAAKKTAPVPAGKKPAKPAQAATIRFSCDECDKAMQAKPEHAGKTVRCPGCQASVKVPWPEVEDEIEEDFEEIEEEEADEEEEERPRNRIQAEKPKPKAANRPLRRDDDDEVDDMDEDEEEDDRPRKKKKKVKQGLGLGLWIGIGVGALLLIGGGVVAAVFWMGGGSSAGDLAMIPDDAQFFITVRAGEVWGLPQVQDFVKNLPKDPDGDVAAKAEQTLGVAVSDLERFTYVFKDAKSEKGWWMLTSNKPIDRKKVTEKGSWGLE